MKMSNEIKKLKSTKKSLPPDTVLCKMLTAERKRHNDCEAGLLSMLTHTEKRLAWALQLLFETSDLVPHLKAEHNPRISRKGDL